MNNPLFSFITQSTSSKAKLHSLLSSFFESDIIFCFTSSGTTLKLLSSGLILFLGVSFPYPNPLPEGGGLHS